MSMATEEKKETLLPDGFLTTLVNFNSAKKTVLYGEARMRIKMLKKQIVTECQNMFFDDVQFFSTTNKFSGGSPGRLKLKPPLQAIDNTYSDLLECKRSLTDLSDGVGVRARYGRGSCGGTLYNIAADCKFFKKSVTITGKVTSTPLSGIEDVMKLIEPHTSATRVKKINKYFLTDPRLSSTSSAEKNEDGKSLPEKRRIIFDLTLSCGALKLNDSGENDTPIIVITSLSVVN